MRDNNGGKHDLEQFLAARTRTPMGAIMSLAMHCIVLSLAIDLYSGQHGVSRFFGVLATVMAMDLVPSLIAAVERWHASDKY